MGRRGQHPVIPKAFDRNENIAIGQDLGQGVSSFLFTELPFGYPISIVVNIDLSYVPFSSDTFICNDTDSLPVPILDTTNKTFSHIVTSSYFSTDDFISSLSNTELQQIAATSNPQEAYSFKSTDQIGDSNFDGGHYIGGGAFPVLSNFFMMDNLVTGVLTPAFVTTVESSSQVTAGQTPTFPLPSVQPMVSTSENVSITSDTSQASNGWEFQSSIFVLMDAGAVTAQKLANFQDYINAYKADGLNTITLVTWVPVNPNTGQIETAFTDSAFNEVAETPQYLAAFTDAAEADGMKVIWKPQFVLDNGTNNNVNDWSLGTNFYPKGTSFSVNTFLSDVQQFWSQWAPVAQQNNVAMLVLGTEQGAFASAPYTQQWLNIIQTARSDYTGLLTYAENHFGPQSWEPNVQFWNALDVIGIDDYAPIGNGTANTPYAYAYAHIFQSLIDQSSPAPQEDIPGILYNLHTEFNKPVFFTEFGAQSIDGAMNSPAFTVGSVNYPEQANYFQANLDVFENYSWVEGLNIWNQENEDSTGPSSTNWNTYFDQYLAGGYEFLGKPSSGVLQSYWADGAVPPPIVAAADLNPNGTFTGTIANPDTLVGGFQNDTFLNLGGVYAIVGGGGVDTAIYSEPSTAFTISGTFDTLIVTSNSGAEGTGTLHQVSILKFSDETLEFNSAGQTQTINDSITKLYIGYYNRAPDPAGENYWVGRLENGMSLSAIAQSYSVQTESTNLYPFLASPNTASTAAVQAFVTSVYENLFNRAPDTAGENYWVTQLQTGASTVGGAIINIISGAQLNDLATINNKVIVGNYFDTQIFNNNVQFSASVASAAFSSVTSNASSIATAEAIIEAYVKTAPHAMQAATTSQAEVNLVGVSPNHDLAVAA